MFGLKLSDKEDRDFDAMSRLAKRLAQSCSMWHRPAELKPEPGHRALAQYAADVLDRPRKQRSTQG